MIRQVLHSDVGAVIQYILVSSGQIPLASTLKECMSTSPNSEAHQVLCSDTFSTQLSSLFGIVCATHLSILFHSHGGILCLPNAKVISSVVVPRNGDCIGFGDNEVDFLTHLVLELVEKLNSDNYPIEVCYVLVVLMRWCIYPSVDDYGVFITV